MIVNEKCDQVMPDLNQSRPKNLMLVTPPCPQGGIVVYITNNLTGPAKNNNLFSDSSP
jgi:hypothetical protein